ncbi:unnamed protein product, partial [Thlaspi arvense]
PIYINCFDVCVLDQSRGALASVLRLRYFLTGGGRRNDGLCPNFFLSPVLARARLSPSPSFSPPESKAVRFRFVLNFLRPVEPLLRNHVVSISLKIPFSPRLS